MSDDVIAGLDNDDWTRREEPPYGQDTPDVVSDNMEIDVDFLEGVSSEDIAKGSFRNIGPGKHVVEILQIDGYPEPKTKKVYLKTEDGDIKVRSFDAQSVTVIFCLPGDDNCQVRGFLVLPPADPEQRYAWERGFTSEESAKKAKSASQGGFHARTLKQFLAALGYEADSKGRLDKRSSRIVDWKKDDNGNRRRLRLEVDAARPMPRKKDPETGELMPEKMGFPSVHMFSYAPVKPKETKEASSSASTASTSSSGSASTAAPSNSATENGAGELTGDGAEGGKKGKKSKVQV